ncbi:hypothetical protein [Cohnella yongneupensis]|uniref:Uncharacterized protein n=1 Tax=Cohnella yongneupensis TaxID=425006 RepID=A0ABW0R3V8_9BACL
MSEGQKQRRLTASPGIMNKLLFRIFIGNGAGAVEQVAVDGYLKDNEPLEFAEGWTAISIPGHCLGQMALY